MIAIAFGLIFSAPWFVIGWSMAMSYRDRADAPRPVARSTRSIPRWIGGAR